MRDYLNSCICECLFFTHVTTIVLSSKRAMPFKKKIIIGEKGLRFGVLLKKDLKGFYFRDEQFGIELSITTI